MKKRKNEKRIRAIGIRREKPDLHKLARALIEVAEEEIRQQEDFIAFLKSHSSRVNVKEVDDWTVLSVDKLQFAAFNGKLLCCHLSRDICVNEFSLEGPKKWPKGEDGTIVLENRNMEEWKRLGLSALKYAIKLTEKN